jgi:hypothetical protein
VIIRQNYIGTYLLTSPFYCSALRVAFPLSLLLYNLHPPKKPQSESQDSKHAEPKKIVRLEVYPMAQSTFFMENNCGEVGKEDAKKVRVCADT